jgi:nicotinamide riboside transporter PnuC
MNQQVLGWITAVIAVCGSLLINYKNFYGMFFYMVANVLWVYYGLVIQVNYPQVFMYIVFTIINLHGVYKWKIQKRSAK